MTGSFLKSKLYLISPINAQRAVSEQSLTASLINKVNCLLTIGGNNEIITPYLRPSKLK